mmetsp:Transcript_11392/g.34847  ORF Transcript_11392/g.34847 Transcript_11392/m.34847 type:complete len:100 (+) Transcript_11392:395-694(+)
MKRNTCAEKKGQQQFTCSDAAPPLCLHPLRAVYSIISLRNQRLCSLPKRLTSCEGFTETTMDSKVVTDSSHRPNTSHDVISAVILRQQIRIHPERRTKE